MPKTKLVDSVNVQVANFTVLYEKLHHFHWFVKGHHFFELHKKFEELYNEVSLHLDELAERLLIKGDKPVSTLKECLDIATIKEATGKEAKEEEMVQAVVDDFSQMIGEIKETISLAEEEEDPVTADMLTAINESLGKHVWMLTSFLG
ncbi:DNA starvation/stationary phase protection protein [Neobacillus sp. PS3-34]|uniref:Dps family protein n=1 Tax=Neobacillus sp. PS3-34 TaxID=3070678 RepID=UPI0027E0ABA9|nr:DNA starvation/stationary phase protection protein [Neobacillus sp. PS3-34]WML47239.1 DNA starvation/stationary phase protection protein [Neobacillus sp. PS3-34]